MSLTNYATIDQVRKYVELHKEEFINPESSNITLHFSNLHHLYSFQDGTIYIKDGLIRCKYKILYDSDQLLETVAISAKFVIPEKLNTINPTNNLGYIQP